MENLSQIPHEQHADAQPEAHSSSTAKCASATTCEISSENMELLMAAGVNTDGSQPTSIDEVIKMLQNSSKFDAADSGTEEDLKECDQTVSPSRKRTRTRGSRLPKELQGLMGEANLKFARGEYQEVIVMCKEIIRSAPYAPEPYQTLSMLYEDAGDSDNAYQFGLVAAHLNPRNADDWMKLAEMAMDAGNLADTEMCYRKVIKYDRENVHVMLECVQLNMQLEEHKKAIDMLKMILETQVAKNDRTMFMSLSKELSKLHHQQGNVDMAISVMKKAFEVAPDAITSEEVNLFSELHLAEHQYRNVLDLLCQHCGVICSMEGHFTSIPNELPVDLRSKFIVCLAHLKMPEVFEIVLPKMEEENPEDVGDLFLDVAEALMENSYHSSAKSLLYKLSRSESYNLAVVWLRYSDCLYALGELQAAADAYGTVVELAPNHTGARVALSQVQQDLGLEEEALQTLADGAGCGDKQDWSEFENKSSRLLLHTTTILQTQSKFDQYFRVVRYLLFGQLPLKFAVTHETMLMNSRPMKSRSQAMRKYLPGYDALFRVPPGQTGENPMSTEECWELFLQATSIAHSLGAYKLLFDLSLNGFATHPFYTKRSYSEAMELICLSAHILLRYGGFAFDIIRDQVMKSLTESERDQYTDHTNQLFNLFSMITTISPHDVRFSRYCERLMQKHPKSIPIHLAHGHGSIIFGSYKSALNQFITVYNHLADDPLINLLIGICFIHITCQKFSTQRATLVAQAVCFLNKYLSLRGHCQESYYNIARAMQQISINNAAVHYYQKALQCKPSVDEPNFDLTMESAFNLSLIYRSSGSPELADMMVQKYCVIK